MGKLDLGKYLDKAPDRVGQVRVDHVTCPAGIDTRRRLYLTRKEDGNVYGYCHNCGNGDIHRSTNAFRRPVLPKNTKTIEEEEVITMPRLENNTCYWPKEMLIQLKEWRIDLTTAAKYGITYDPVSNRIVIPKVNREGTLVQYQTRRLVDDGTPKYLTRKVKGEYIHHELVPEDIINNNVCIIVEDMISAIRLNGAGYIAVPLFRSDADEDTLLTLCGKYAKIIVWLDNDGADVDRHADDMVKKFRLMDQAAVRVLSARDPKHYDEFNLVHYIDDMI